ncbi:UNVERIFIED_CONTAM: hypothetical protein FKN15_018229 [Acipenser sinensis]
MESEGSRDELPNTGILTKNLEKSDTEKLHLAALASLKGDIVELNKRLQQTERERDLLEKRLGKAQCEQSHLMREHEEVQEGTTLRYEERITELHSIIAELNKKIDRLQGTTIRIVKEAVLAVLQIKPFCTEQR